jgi:putative DNA primase/helicase
MGQAARRFDLAQDRLAVERKAREAAEIDQLALLSPLEYGHERKEAAKRLSVAVGYLDKEVEDRRRQLVPANTQAQGRPLVLPELEPASDPVSGHHLLVEMTAALERYVVLPVHSALAISLWIIRAHADDCFDTNPRLALLSPEKRCGKTTLLEIIAKLVPRALATSNVRPAVIYRTIEASHPTLLIDEVDSFSEAHEELRGILNSGHRRDTATVLRTVGDDHEARIFSTWCPMLLAAIGSLPGTIEDRSVIVRMRRRAPDESVQSVRWVGKAGEALRARLHSIGRAAARWACDHAPELMNREPAIPPSLNDRAADNWSPLLAIAETIGEEWAGRARQAAVALSGGSDTTQASNGVQLLDDIRSIFTAQGVDRLRSKDLCERLADLEERPWAQYGRGKPLSPHQLSRLLKPFKVDSQSIREGGDTGKGYHLDSFGDAFKRYLPPSETVLPPENQDSKRHNVTSGHQSGDEALFQKVTSPSCDVSKNGTNPAPGAGCDDVTFQNQLFEGEDIILEEDACS